jgi:hypothetical protein
MMNGVLISTRSCEYSLAPASMRRATVRSQATSLSGQIRNSAATPASIVTSAGMKSDRRARIRDRR